MINPNNPSGAVYSRATLQAIVELAERHGLVVLADEIYDQMVYDDAEFIPMATLVRDTVCLTYSGLSKIYRACGYRVGWCVFSGDLERAAHYLQGDGVARGTALVQQRARRNGRCRQRWAASRASPSWSARVDGCTSRARRSSTG